MKRSGTYLVMGLFFGSGAAGLIYEVAWTRMFSVVAGGTTHALTAVLVAYMTGLALGSFLGGRYVDRQVRRPLLVYGILEGGIGLFALLMPLVIPALLSVLKIGHALLGPESFRFELYRFLTCALALLLPTTLMGATFPVLLRGLLSRREQFGFFAGLLYAANTLGAMTGALVSGFVLIPALGLRLTVWSAAGINLVILAVIAASSTLRERQAEKEVREEIEPVQARGPSWGLTVLLAGYGVSGLCAMVYQVGWARVLALSLSNSTYALGLILAAYIGGLALGGAVMTPLVDRLRRPLVWAAGLEVVIGLTALFVMPLFAWATGRMFDWAAMFQDRFGAYQAVRFAVAFGLILLPTGAMGALFPLVVKIAGLMHRGVGEPAGEVYGANTVGAILGAFLAGYILIRWLGVETSLLFATGMSVAVGVTWLMVFGKRRLVRLAAGAGLAAVAGVAIRAIPPWDPLVMNSGPYLYAPVVKGRIQPGRLVQDAVSKYRLLYYREGVEATVSVLETKSTGELSLRINGKTDASSRGDLPTEILSAHIPLLLHPAPKKVMVLGLASGVTAGSALTHPEVERLDCVEISPEVVEASHFFEQTSQLNYQDPRFHLILDDARNYLALADVRYDAITIESTNPWIAGIGQLFTREFFQLLADHLEPGGVALIFFPAYDMDADTVRMVLRTYASVFPYTALWETIPATDYLVAGSREPFRLDPAGLQKRITEPAVAADLARVGVTGVDLFSSFVMGSERLTRVAGAGPLHTDDRRQLEFIMPKLRDTPSAPRQEGIIREILSQHEPAAVIIGLSDEKAKAPFIDFDRARELQYQARLLSNRGAENLSDLEQMIRAWREVLEVGGQNFGFHSAARALATALLGRAQVRLAAGDAPAAAADWQESFQRNPYNFNSVDQLINYYLNTGRRDQARAWAKKALVYLPGDPFVLAVLGHLAQQEKLYAEAEQWFRKGLSLWPQRADLQWSLAAALAGQKKFPEAEQELRSLLKRDPENLQYLKALADTLRSQGRPGEAEKYLRRVEKISSERALSPPSREKRP